MKILVRHAGTKQWKTADEKSAGAEAELQELLVESPSLVPIGEIRDGVSPLVFAVSEFGLPASGASDILAFNSQGDIAIIECKLAANPEIKRKVIGQILEYAASLWGMSYEEVDRRIKNMKGKSLADLVAECTGGEWDEEQFREGVKQTLERGSFILIIAVDEINEELRRTIRYLNECSKFAFSLHALEMKEFQIDNLEILVPHLHGVSTKPFSISERTQWSEEEFFENFEEKVPEAVGLVKDLYEWSKNTADKTQFGAGKNEGSFTFYYLKEGKTVSIFSVYTGGRLVLNYGQMNSKLPEKTLIEFHKLIHEIPTMRHVQDDFSKYPSVKIDSLSEPDLQKFKDAVLWLKGQIESNEPK
ncbi:MAG: hypothetical protein ABC585_00145 [Candidatus Methanosuratincola petrocarbonis]